MQPITTLMWLSIKNLISRHFFHGKLVSTEQIICMNRRFALIFRLFHRFDKKKVDLFSINWLGNDFTQLSYYITCQHMLSSHSSCKPRIFDKKEVVVIVLYQKIKMTYQSPEICKLLAKWKRKTMRLNSFIFH